MMNKPLTIIALVVAIIATIFHFAAIGGNFLIVLVLAAIVLLAAGALRGE